MSKNMNSLKEVSEFFTEETLKNVIAESNNVDESSIEILSWSFETISGKGDNFLSVVNKVQINSKVKNETLNTKLIVKSLPKNAFQRKILRSSEFFHNEIIFYDKIASKFISYLVSKNQDQFLCLPRCFAHHYDEENDFIVLEDVTCRGYATIPQQSYLSYSECRYFLEAMARFHGVSFGFKNEHKEEFNRLSGLLNETLYRNDIYEASLKYFYDDLFRIAKDALAKEYPGSKGETVFNSYQADYLFGKTIEICTKINKAETSVISHGDTWAPNFMIRKTTSGKLDIIMIDFQIARCASPVLDVVFFIYQCTDKIVRDEYFYKLLDDYYAELAKTMRILGADPDKLYPVDLFQNEVKQQSLYGLMFALINIPMVLGSTNQVFDLDSTEEIADFGNFNRMPNLEKSEDRRRLADVILHAVENGFI